MPEVNPLRLLTTADKRLFFGDYCEYRRDLAIKALRKLTPQSFCRYCAGPLPHTLAYCLQRGRRAGNPHLDPIMFSRDCTGLPDPIDPKDVTDKRGTGGYRCMDGTIRRP